mmetsp:Transcript_12635/g.21600  ORF Transcript_12635/g.21600 Transcript_12635/m.21600 type:complete len:293 (+) Transcript_12635:991-1869(+)
MAAFVALNSSIGSPIVIKHQWTHITQQAAVIAVPKKARCSPISMLFGKGKDSGSASSSSSSSSSENPYRVLGVSEDATYEQVESAYQSLKEKFKDQPKKVIFFEIQKEKIFEDRLQKRISGQMSAKVKESPYDRRVREAREKRTFADKYLPEFVRSVLKVPNASYLRKTVIVMAVCMVLAIGVPQFAGSAIAMGFIASTYLLYTRGQPEPAKEAYEGGGYTPPPSAPVDRKAVIKTVIINILTTGVFLGFAQLLLMFVPMPAFLAPDSVVAVMMLLGMWIACLFFQTTDEDK